jgi:hypothetical protein
MLEIIRPPEDNMKVEIAEEGLTEEFKPIEEMGRLRSWRIQSAPLTKQEYIELKNELEKPGFLRVTGKFLHPNQEKVLYLKVKSEIISLNEERDDIHYSIEFRLKDAEGLYGGAQDVSPTHTTIVFELLDINKQPLSDVEIEIYNITRTTDENGKARFDNFYTLKEFNFATGQWEYNEQGLDYTIMSKDGKTWEITRNVYIEQERYDITLTIDQLNESFNLDCDFGLEYENMYSSINYTVEDYESRQILDYEVNLFDEHQVILPTLRELGFTEDENGRLQEDITIEIENYFGDNRVSSDDSFNIVNAGGLTLTLNKDNYDFAELSISGQGSWTMEAPRLFPGCPAPPSSPISASTALAFEEYPEETSWRTFNIKMKEDGVGDVSLYGIPTYPSSLNEYLSTDCKYWDDVNEEYVYYSFSDDSQSCTEQHYNGKCVGINYKKQHTGYGVYDEDAGRRYITGINLDQPITIGKFNGKVRNIKVKKNGTIVGQWNAQSPQPYSRYIEPITGNLKAKLSKGTVDYFWVNWQEGDKVDNALIEAETAAPPDIAQQKSTTTDINGESTIPNMILDGELMEYTISKTGYSDVSHLMERKSNEFFKNKISNTEDFVLSNTFDKFNDYINGTFGGSPTEQERYDFYTNFREELKAGTKDYRNDVAIPFNTRLVKLFKDLIFMYQIVDEFGKNLPTNRYFSSQDAFVKKQSSDIFDIYGHQIEEPVSISVRFEGLEYQEMLIDVQFTVRDWDSNLVSGCNIYYTNHRNDYFEVTTNPSGQATLSDFRADENHTVYFEYNGEITQTIQMITAQEAGGAGWDFVTKDVVLLEGGSYPEYLDTASVSLDNFDMAYEGGFFIDFSRTNELDNWTSRYVSDFETWSIIDDVGATGGKLLKHDTSQNIRRLFSFDPLWELWTDEQFGKRAWEDMEIVGKVKATVDTGNQNRLHVRSGYNIGDAFPTDVCNPNYLLVGLFYKTILNINFTVKDDLDSTLLEGATITLTLDYGETKQQTTDLNGEVSFLDEDSGTLTYDYEVTRPSYQTTTGTFTVDKETTTHNEEVLMTAI